MTSPDGARLHAVADDRAAFEVPSVSTALLRRFDHVLRSATVVADRRMSEIAAHLIDAGGKRLRPTLVLASALAVGGPEGVTPRVMDAAVAVELFHLASLYHDDVLDGAVLRRGWPSANAQWGNERAVLGGDVLLAHGYRVAAGLGPDELCHLSESSLEVCCGQVAECDQRFDRARSVSDYELSIGGKTAALVSTACWLGARTAGADRDVAERLGEFGTSLGVAFQIVDDLKDLCGDSRVFGKPTGNDLREGIFTLPVLLALEHDPALAELLTEGIDDGAIAEVRRRVRTSGSDRLAAERASAHLHAATSQLAAIDLEPEGRAILGQLARAVVGQLALLRFDDVTPDDAVAGDADIATGPSDPAVRRQAR